MRCGRMATAVATEMKKVRKANPYFVFVREWYKKVKEENPGSSRKKIRFIVTQMWKDHKERELVKVCDFEEGTPVVKENEENVNTSS
jgi:HMG (high mobility group) box